MTATYRKKPIEVEVSDPINSENGAEIAAWCGGEFNLVTGGGSDDAVPDLSIPTLEGVMHASRGDYVIRGVSGEFYPCKPDIFAATYEPVTQSLKVLGRAYSFARGLHESLEVGATVRSHWSSSGALWVVERIDDSTRNRGNGPRLTLRSVKSGRTDARYASELDILETDS